MSTIGRILGITSGCNLGPVNKVDAINANKFIQSAVTSKQQYNLYHPACANSTPYGDSPLAKRLDISA